MANDNMGHNRLRQLAGLVSLESWYSRTTGAGTDFELHAYLNIGEGRLGGRPGDEIAFRLSLRQAELRLLQSDPPTFRINPASIWRGDVPIKFQHSRHRSADETNKSSTKRKFRLSKSPSADFDKSKSEEMRSGETETVQVERTSRAITINYSGTDRGRPAWRLMPNDLADDINGIKVISGLPWDDTSRVLLKMIAERSAVQKDMLSALRLCLVCKSEDLVFHDFHIRQKDGSFCPVPDSSPKRLVAQEYLKELLIREELHTEDMSSPFSIINLGEVISEHQVGSDRYE